MEAEKYNWATLLDKYVNNELTSDEHEDMERQMKVSPVKQRQFKERTDPREFINQLKQVYYIDTERSLDNLQVKLPFLQQPSVVPFYKRPVFAWSFRVAAVLVLVVGLWSLQFLLNSSGLPTKSYPYIMLPDGSERNLDSASGVLYVGNGYRIWYADAEIVIDVKEKLDGQIHDKIGVASAFRKNIGIRLSDTSKVTLNGQSTLRTPVFFSDNSRNIELTGEGFFDVTKMPDLPFVVSCLNKIAVIAEGTTFNVRSYEGQEVITTLIKGKVVMAIGRDSMRLKEGEQVATINKRSFTLPIRPDKEKVTAWTSNVFYFDNKNIQEIMLEIGRWYGYDVEFTGKDATEMLLSGKLSRNLDLDQLIYLLETGTHIKIKKEGKKLIISPKK